VTVAQAAEVTGRAVDASGKPLPFIRIRIMGQDATRFSTTVFTTGDGSFDAPDVNISGTDPQVDAFRIGWTEVKRDVQRDPRGR
jgi:hypothetical protein